MASRGPRHYGEAERDPDPGGHAPIGLPRGFGIPPAGSNYRRSRVPSPFDLRLLPLIERESVDLWKVVHEYVPAYLRSAALVEALKGFTKRLLSPEDQEQQGIVVVVKKLDDQSVKEHRFNTLEVTIGSHATSQVQLAGAQISRRHCRLVQESGAWQLVDQGSSNGTYHRGERLQSGYGYPVRNGETFTIPSYEITVRWNDKPPAPKLEGVRVTSLRIEPKDAFLKGVPRQGVVAAVRVEPGGSLLFLELDLPLCQLLVSRVLGLAGGPKAGEKPRADEVVQLKPLGEVEKGVLELVCVKLIDDLQRGFGPQGDVTLHLARLYDGASPELPTAMGGVAAVVASAALDFDNRRDAVRVAMPRATVERLGQTFSRDVEAAGGALHELYARYRGLLGVVRVPLSVKVGAMKVTRADLRTLERGSICFPDDLSLRIAGDRVEGEATLIPVLGGGAAFLKARIVEFGVAVKVEILEVVTGAGKTPSMTRSEVRMSNQGQVAGDEELGQGAAMLDDVPVAMIVELGRLPVTVRDLAAMRPGQVLELGRGAEDPIHLVIEGHVVGTGKLVNVEGEIGIQILELMR